ncbi:ANTAR domain-containing response regulator [Paenibacillus marinisediminis]
MSQTAAALNVCLRKSLIVDDDALIRMDLREMLHEYGYDVVAEARNGEEAIELAHLYQPEFILMDVNMPGCSGLQAAKSIRKLSASWPNGSPAVILLTAYSEARWIEEAKQAGVTAYLVKPVSEENLIPAIEVACNQRDMMLHMHREMAALQQTLMDRKRIERAKGLLMEQQGLNEEQAYEWLRDQSMKRRLSIRELAERVIDSYTVRHASSSSRDIRRG